MDTILGKPADAVDTVALDADGDEREVTCEERATYSASIKRFLSSDNTSMMGGWT